MKTKILFFSFIFSIFFIACDPGRVLSFHTSGKPNVSITVYANTGILPGHYTSTPEKIVIHLPDPAKKIRTTALYYMAWEHGQTGTRIQQIIIFLTFPKISTPSSSLIPTIKSF